MGSILDLQKELSAEQACRRFTTFQRICPPDPSVTGRQRRYPVRTRATPAGAALPFPSFVTL
jgi:hypothetical protein